MEHVDWSEILGWNDEHFEELRFIGYAYIREGKYSIAQSFFEALVALNPTSAYDVQTLGAIFLQKEEYAKALFYLDQSLKLDSQDRPSQLNRCKALLAVGRNKEGLRLARELKDIKDPDVSDIATALCLRP